MLLAMALPVSGAWAAEAPMAAGANAATAAPPDATQVATLVEQLHADRFDVRSRAAERLEKLADDPSWQPALAETLQQVLLRAETPFEVRALCEPLLLRLPPPAERAAGPLDEKEIDKLLLQADAETYGLRVGAAARLAWLAHGNPPAAFAVAQKLKRRLADPELSSEARRRLTRVWSAARVAWLTSDPATWPAPTATSQQIDQWLATLASPTADRLAKEAAERELVDLAAYESETPKLRSVVERHLADPALDSETQHQLERIHEFTRPGMAAEIWIEHSHRTVQYLLVDVPQHPDEAPRATHFDRVDDSGAHCVSGNSLAAGDYPVGVAIPPTLNAQGVPREGLMFHLVNLPTARRRLLYEYQHLKTDEDERLIQLSQRTVDWMLRRKTVLSEREIAMLRQLDAGVVSRFAGPYLLAVDDQPMGAGDESPIGARASRHAMLCLLLAEYGTHEAVPGLADAARRGRLLQPSDDVPYHVAWLAALSIAQRDPWPEVDDWLASLVPSSEPLTARGLPRPELGATAAAMLLDRNGATPGEFGLVELAGQVRGFGIPASRFQTPQHRREVLDWWKRQQERRKAAGA